MFKHIATLVLTSIFGLILGSPANAQTLCPDYCDWLLAEVYSNADGSVQFLLVLNTVPGTLAGKTLVASDGTTENSFTFPADPPDAAGPWVLVGTQGFDALGIVKPDFVVPNGFLFVFNGSVKLRPSNWYAGTLHYAALPTDGVKALYPNADRESFEYTETAEARNSAGQSYIFPPAQKFSGLWWNAPSGSESGWGIAVDHQGETVFAAWASYDTDGSPTWLVMPAAKHVIAGPDDPSWYYFGYPNSYLGDIYRVTGPALSAFPFDPSMVIATKVGSGGIRFSTNADDVAYNNGDNSAFWFNFTTPEQYIVKSITRQVFGTPMPICVEGAAPGPTPNFQGMWWNPPESGWGLHLAHQGDIIVAVWFTYDTVGKATWFVMAANKTAPNIYSGAIYRTTGPAYSAVSFDPTAVTETQVGTATLTFTDRNNGTFSYVVDGVAQTKSITRQIFADPPTVCN